MCVTAILRIYRGKEKYLLEKATKYSEKQRRTNDTWELPFHASLFKLSPYGQGCQQKLLKF